MMFKVTISRKEGMTGKMREIIGVRFLPKIFENEELISESAGKKAMSFFQRYDERYKRKGAQYSDYQIIDNQNIDDGIVLPVFGYLDDDLDDRILGL